MVYTVSSGTAKITYKHTYIQTNRQTKRNQVNPEGGEVTHSLSDDAQVPCTHKEPLHSGASECITAGSPEPPLREQPGTEMGTWLCSGKPGKCSLQNGTLD